MADFRPICAPCSRIHRLTESLFECEKANCALCGSPATAYTPFVQEVDRLVADPEARAREVRKELTERWARITDKVKSLPANEKLRLAVDLADAGRSDHAVAVARQAIKELGGAVD